ncbi:MAG: winged helix-turn-helix transcriptional regulator [Bacteroidales bacterium]|nr:winged helix-turn-helix transcriptional regulator [Bacteroidales bacterium]
MGNEPDVEAMAEFYPDEEDTNENVTANEPVNDPVNDPINDPVNGTLKSQIVELIRVNPNINAIQLTKRLNKSLRQIKRFLSELQSSGIIHHVGAKKNGYWEVINNLSDK